MSSNFLKRMQLFPISSLVLACLGYSFTNQLMRLGLAYIPMWYKAMKFFCEAILINGKACLGLQW